MLKRARVLIVLITALVLLGGFLPTGIANADWNDTQIYVWVGSTRVTDGNMSDVLNDGGSVTYDKGSNTLTLTNATITESTNPPTLQMPGEDMTAGIFSCGRFGLTIKLVGDSYISSNADAGIYAITDGEQTTNALTINGEGSLTITGAHFQGIRTRENLLIGGGTINAGASENNYSRGIYADTGSVTIQDGTVTAYGSREGIEGKTGVTISGGTINASASENNEDSCGISADTGSVTIQNGTVTAYGSQKGIEGKTGVAISGGTVTAKNADDYVCPIAPVDGTISIATTHEITTPEGAWVDTGGKTIKYWAKPYDPNANSRTATKTVVIEPKKPHAITIADTVGGTVTTNPSEAANSGDSVKITVIPDNSGTVKKLLVIDSTGHTVAVNNDTFTMPSTDVTVYAWFVDPTVTVDFGEGHEGFVRNYYEGKTGSTDSAPDQGTNVPFTVEGTKVTYTLASGSNMYAARTVIQSFSGSMFDADFLDNGVYFMNEYGITGTTPDRYEDKQAYDAEWSANGYDPIPGAGVTLHALWAQPTGDVSITVEPLECGTNVEYSYPSGQYALIRSHPGPVFQVSGNASIDLASAQNWYTTEAGTNPFEGTTLGGTDYYAWALAKPSFGYFFNDVATTVTVTNDPKATIQITDPPLPLEKPYGTKISILAKVTATHKGEWTQSKAPTCTEKGEKKRTCESCQTPETADVDPLGHTWGEWEQTKAPTCTEEGIEERVCSRNDSQETRDVAVDPTAHNWGEPTYTWSGDNATCTATRSCRNDAGHVETEVAQATSTVTREPTATEAGTRTYTATFGNAAFAKQTKDVEIPATGEGDAGATYTVVAGANVTWTKGSSTDATVTIKRTEDDGTTFAHFTGITMDGNEVPANQYRKQPGSVVITLPAAYLETLSVGEHALVAKFDDGSVATKLTVQAAATPTPTDPDADPTKPGTDPTNPSTEPTNPSTDPAKPGNTSTTPTPKATPKASTATPALPKTADESSAPLAASLVGIAALCFLAARGVKRA